MQEKKSKKQKGQIENKWQDNKFIFFLKLSLCPTRGLNSWTQDHESHTLPIEPDRHPEIVDLNLI